MKIVLNIGGIMAVLGSGMAKFASRILCSDTNVVIKEKVVRKPLCHPDRPHHIKGLCYLCYSRRAVIRKIMGSNWDEKLYESLLESQGGACKICREFPTEDKPLYVDHDHETMVIRGLICCRCNNLLRAWVTPERLRMIADYLDGGKLLKMDKNVT